MALVFINHLMLYRVESPIFQGFIIPPGAWKTIQDAAIECLDLALSSPSTQGARVSMFYGYKASDGLLDVRTIESDLVLPGGPHAVSWRRWWKEIKRSVQRGWQVADPEWNVTRTYGGVKWFGMVVKYAPYTGEHDTIDDISAQCMRYEVHGNVSWFRHRRNRDSYQAYVNGTFY